MNAREYLDAIKEGLGAKTDDDLAVAIGASSSAISKWIQRDKVPDKWVTKIGLLSIEKTGSYIKPSGSTGVDLETATRRHHTIYKKEDPSLKDIPVVKLEAGSGEGVYNFQPQKTLISLNPSVFPFVEKGNATAIEIVGDSMSPDLINGDYIIIVPLNGDRRDDGIYAIRVDGMLKVKNLHFRLDGNIDIISSNSKYPIETYIPNETQIDFEILGSMKLHISR